MGARELALCMFPALVSYRMTKLCPQLTGVGFCLADAPPAFAQPDIAENCYLIRAQIANHRHQPSVRTNEDRRSETCAQRMHSLCGR